MEETKKAATKTKVLSTSLAFVKRLIKAAIKRTYFKKKKTFLITKTIFFLSGFIFSNMLSNIDLKNDANKAVSIAMITVVAVSLFSISSSISSIITGLIKWLKNQS